MPTRACLGDRRPWRALHDTLPSVATSYTSSEDARQFTFKLHRGVLFSDGSRLTSAEVAFSPTAAANLKGPALGLPRIFIASALAAYTTCLTASPPNPERP